MMEQDQEVEIVINGENNNTNLLINCNNSAIGNIKKTEIIEDPLKDLDKKYIYAINQNVDVKLLNIFDATINVTEAFYLNYINNQLLIDHLHKPSYNPLKLNDDNLLLTVLEVDTVLTLDYIPYTVKFPMIKESHSNSPVNNFNLLTDEEKDMLRNGTFIINDDKLIKFCENIINNIDSRFKTKKLIGNYNDAPFYLSLLNPLSNQIIFGKAYEPYSIYFINYENNILDFYSITNVVISEDPTLNSVFGGIDWQINVSTGFKNFDMNISNELPEQFDKKHGTLPAIFTSLQFKIVNVNIIQNENIEISFDVNGGWIWRDLTNEHMQMASHVDGEGHAHIHIGGKKLGRTYNGKYTITKEVLNDYINNEFWVPDPLNITISLVNNMHQGYTNQSLDLEGEKIYGIYYYEAIDVNKIKNL